MTCKTKLGTRNQNESHIARAENRLKMPVFRKTATHTLSICCFTLSATILPSSVMANSIPEPGLEIYGVVSNTTNVADVTWLVSSTSSSVSVAASLININGQNFYLATIPFETRSLGGISLGAPAPNTLSLNPTPTSYARQATVNGTNACIIYASSGSTNTFTFGPADRGGVERVDLAVSPPPTFAQWLTQYGLPANSNPNSDPTHKGMTLLQQYIAGLNPIDPNSIFKFVGIQPNQEGLQVQWSSAAGELYALQQAISPAGPFSIVQSNIVATPGTNTFVLPMPPNGTSLFLRVVVQPPD
jgi:hypothetical protein